MEPAGNRNVARRRMPQSKRGAEVNDVRSVITELRVIAQDEFGEHEMSVRQVCADAAEHLMYYRQLECRESPGNPIFRPLTLEDWLE